MKMTKSLHENELNGMLYFAVGNDDDRCDDIGRTKGIQRERCVRMSMRQIYCLICVP